MPTKKRISVPGAIAHIMARSIEGIALFKDDADRQYFQSQLAESIKKTNIRCYGWVLMTDHYHLVVRCSDSPLHELMRTINSRYAKYFNSRYTRRGYLFQDRFKSILTQDQRYLEELIRYVHLNPIRAGICKSLEELDRYQWCGHSVLMGFARHTFQTTEPVLRRFGSTNKAAREKYREFIGSGINSIDSNWLVDTVRNSNRSVEKKDQPSCWVIGDKEFIVSVMRKHEQRLRTVNVLRQQWSLEDVLKKIALDHKLKPEDLRKRSRLSLVSSCRKKFAFISCRALGFPVEEVASYLNLSGPAVSWSIIKGEELVTQKDISKFINLPPG